MTPRNPDPIESLVLPLKPESLQCLYRFMEYKRTPLPHPVPKSRMAAVAIVLFVGRKGDLYVLLSTRSGELRTYAHDTALPGGKYEEGDEDEEGTARREAYEEIGLPIDKERVRCLCMLDPFLAGNQLIVTPVVFLNIDRRINPVLNPAEVEYLFSMPLTAFLYDRPQDIPGWNFGFSEKVRRGADTMPTTMAPPMRPDYASDPVVGSADAPSIGGREGVAYYQYRDVAWGGGVVRMHRFLTGREGGGVKPVYGLTSNILIHAAVVGFGHPPSFQVFAPGQPTMAQRVRHEITRGDGGPLRRAVEKGGMLDAWLNDNSPGAYEGVGKYDKVDKEGDKAKL